MSITDSTTSVDTSWTEHNIVAFVAGTLSDVDDMVTEIESKLKRGTLSTSTSPTLASVKRWCVRAKEELMQIKSYSFSRRYAYASLSTGDYRVSLPPDYNGGSIRVKDQTNNFQVRVLPSHLYDLKYPDPDNQSSGQAFHCCIKNMELWLAPPTSACTMELEYDRSGDDTTATDFSFLPEIERWRCCDYAIYEACESLEDWEKATWYRTKWVAGLSSSRKADARRKWKNMGFRAISMFEEAAARNFQS